MSPDDPRHGSERGHEQHIRDGEDPCEPCRRAKLIAARRRSKRKAQGYVFTLPAGLAHRRVHHWLNRGANLEDIARHTGLEASVLHRIAHGGPDQPIYLRTWRAVTSAPTQVPLTSIGASRRIRALTALGYSLPAIARETGIHHDTILDARKDDTRIVQVRVREAVAAAYTRLEMRLPVGTTQQECAGITRARNLAARNGWCPPMAWDHIDDATEQPHGWHYVPADRADHLADLDERQAGITEVCAALGIRRDSVERWCERNGMRDMYVRFMERETPYVERRNQWSA